MDDNKFYCQKCGRTMDGNQFFTYKNGEKTELCKKCLTMHIDNFDPETFLWLLEKMDVPYIPVEWNGIRDKIYEKDPSKLLSSSVFGRYLSKMKLKQFVDKTTGKPYGWADSEKLQEEYEKNAAAHAMEAERLEAEVQEKYDNGEISEAEYKTLMSATTKKNNKPFQTAQIPAAPGSIALNENLYMSEDELTDPAADLTEDDKIYLAMKWGRLYKPSEWVELEKTYTEMTESFDIQDADTINTLILICKTNLKMNQSLDIGDVDGFQKLSKVSESLRKSAKFTAAQNKEQKNDFVDSVGELVAMCERDGFIPRYATDIPQDKVDLTLKDMNDYLKKLVTQDLGFGQQIEDALKKIQIQKEMNEAEAASQDGLVELEDEDYAAFLNEMEAQKDTDLDLAIEDEDDEEEEQPRKFKILDQEKDD